MLYCSIRRFIIAEDIYIYIKMVDRIKKLQRASKEYLNHTGERKRKDARGYNSLPLVVFPYKMGVRGIVGRVVSMGSLVIPDACICLVVGREIKNPISCRSRAKVGYRDVLGCGVVMFLVGGYHSIRIGLSRKVRKIKKIVLRRRYI